MTVQHNIPWNAMYIKGWWQMSVLRSNYFIYMLKCKSSIWGYLSHLYCRHIFNIITSQPISTDMITALNSLNHSAFSPLEMKPTSTSASGAMTKTGKDCHGLIWRRWWCTSLFMHQQIMAPFITAPRPCANNQLGISQSTICDLYQALL